MPYASLGQLKEYLDIQTTADDGLLESLLSASTAHIDAHTRRRFAPYNAVRTLDEEYVLRTDERWLVLDDDLQSIASISDQGGSVDLSEVRAIPTSPPFRILVRDGKWCPPVSITGTWGYSAAPPDDIVYACMRLAAYWYRMKDAQVFDVTLETGQGALTIPRGVPSDVTAILNKYARRW